METRMARAVSDAVVNSRHPRLDFRTEEAREATKWLSKVKGYIPQGAKLLDIGCSSGKHTFAAEELGAVATGIDCSPEAIKLAREIAQDIDSGAQFVMGDFTSLPFDADTFDVALFSLNIVECTYEEMMLLAQGLQVILRDNGMLLLTMYDDLHDLLSGRRQPPGDYHLPSGKRLGNVTVPVDGKGSKTFEYHTCFWTVAFAIHVIGQHFSFDHLEEIKEGHYLLVFRKESG